MGMAEGTVTVEERRGWLIWWRMMGWSSEDPWRWEESVHS